mmetsp:Transcript_4336/g.11186  ORF Transcript_4336/g.11186 Transcript_4336/m.11186 type:complete len:226 (-) Transcript_4336:530-1207(-)
MGFAVIRYTPPTVSPFPSRGTAMSEYSSFPPVSTTVSGCFFAHLFLCFSVNSPHASAIFSTSSSTRSNADIPSSRSGRTHETHCPSRFVLLVFASLTKMRSSDGSVSMSPNLTPTASSNRINPSFITANCVSLTSSLLHTVPPFPSFVSFHLSMSSLWMGNFCPVPPCNHFEAPVTIVLAIRLVVGDTSPATPCAHATAACVIPMFAGDFSFASRYWASCVSMNT